MSGRTRKRAQISHALAMCKMDNPCLICGERDIDALGFHHCNPYASHTTVAHATFNASWRKVRREVKRCVMLCKRCHSRLHRGGNQLPAVTVTQQGWVMP